MMTYLNDENGAVTIDWVALTAGGLLLGVTLVYAVFNQGVTPVSQTIQTELANVEVLSDPGAAPQF